ncbi:MAG: DNA polymerase I [Phycisphaeraceae bacterium]|nr:DNA polymerase I [Phycisphaeraceae bacterium]
MFWKIKALMMSLALRQLDRSKNMRRVLDYNLGMSKTLYIIDGHAQIFRAYFAIRGGMNSPTTGEPTHAVFGMAGMMLKLLNDVKPQFVIMAIDTKGPTFRDEIYSEYKANREKTPEDLIQQEKRIFDMIRAFGVPIIGVPGAEADDIIATLCKRITEDDTRKDWDIRVVSRDKDLEQLLSERVTMFDIHKDELVTVDTLLEKKGLTPAQVVDALAMIGDTADNIPGIPGIGPKTAVTLLQDFGSIDGIYENIDKIKGKRREKIESAKDRMPLNRQLVQLKDDLDFEFDLETATVGPIDKALLTDMFQTLGFRRHINDLNKITLGGESETATPQTVETKPAATAAPEGFLFGESLFDQGSDAGTTGNVAAAPVVASTKDGEYTCIKTQVELDDAIKAIRKADLLAIDTETIGLGRNVPICGICLSWEEKQGVYIPMVSPQQDEHLDSQTVIDTLKPLLQDPTVKKTGHNLKYDALVLRHAGIHLRGVVFDSMIAAQLLGMASRGMDHLALELLQHRMIPISQLIGEKSAKQATMDTVPLDQVTEYAAEDADISLRFYHLLHPRLVEAQMADLEAVEMPLVEVLSDVESLGIRIDPDVLLAQKEELTGKLDEIKDQIFQVAGEPFNLDSPKQLGEILFHKLGMPILKRKKTGPSTDVEVLEKLAAREDLPVGSEKMPSLLLEYRQFSKLCNTYLDNLRDAQDKTDGRIHASFMQLGAATGRLSSGGPNLQNIPVRSEAGRQIRKAFVAAEGHQLIVADYSQIELRILAHLSQDPALIEAFKNDLDIHAAVASQVFNTPLDEVSKEQRARAKVINFGIVYGITSYGLARRIEDLDEREARALIEDYRKRFAGIDRFLHECVQHALDHGYVKTILGRRRPIDQIHSSNGNTRALGERLAINTVVQGSATGDLIKKAMVNLYNRIYGEKLPLRMICQIHDELIFEAPTSEIDAMREIVRTEMESAMELTVPLKVDVGVGNDWLEAK